jgi:hypothetical protein
MTFGKRIVAFAGSAALGIVLAVAPGALAQTVPTHAQATAPGRVAKQEPCWQVAGISKSAMEQRKSIMQNTRSQVEAVCANSSLTAQQRSEKIHQIHEQAKQQADALVSPSQMESLKSCQSSRASAHPSTPTHHAGGSAGPCGQLPGTPGSASSGSKPEPEGEPEN